MKAWSRPMVAVDVFRPNEYVAKCNTDRPGVAGTSLYVDWDSNGAYESAERVWGHYGDSNLGYNGAQHSGTHGVRSVHVYGINPIFTATPKPGLTRVNASMDSPYLSTSYEAIDNNGDWIRDNLWVDLGVFDVYYISSSGVYIYSSGMSPDGTPSETTAFS